MYTIRGHDGKDYGPVDAAQVQLWLSQGRVSAQTMLRQDGSADWRPLGSFPELIPAASPPLIQSVAPPLPDSGISTLIPYRNAPALVAYYLGVFSLIPCAGLFLGLAAVVLGVMGLRHAGKHPEAKGKIHAWVGIILGGLVFIAHVGLIISIILARERRRMGI